MNDLASVGCQFSVFIVMFRGAVPLLFRISVLLYSPFGIKVPHIVPFKGSSFSLRIVRTLSVSEFKSSVDDGLGFNEGYGIGVNVANGIGGISGSGIEICATICLLQRTGNVVLSMDNENLGVLLKYC